MPIVVTYARQLDLPIVLANEAFLDLTGYAADEVIGRKLPLPSRRGDFPIRTTVVAIAFVEIWRNRQRR